MTTNKSLSDRSCRLVQDVVFVPSEIGDNLEKMYFLIRDLNDNAIYTEKDEVDIQQEINSFEPGCSLYALLERCKLVPSHQLVGMLNQVGDGQSVDTTLFPKDGCEAFTVLQKAKVLVPDLDQRIRAGQKFEDILADVFYKSVKVNQVKEEVLKGVENESSNG